MGRVTTTPVTTSGGEKNRGIQISLRTVLLAFVVLGILFLYAGTYYRLSRRGLREAEEVGLAGFLYVPFEEARRTEDLRYHHFLTIVFVPANAIDRNLFGGPTPIQGILWDLE